MSFHEDALIEEQSHSENDGSDSPHSKQFSIKELIEELNEGNDQDLFESDEFKSFLTKNINNETNNSNNLNEILEKDQQEWLDTLKKNQKSYLILSKKVKELKGFLSKNQQDTKDVNFLWYFLVKFHLIPKGLSFLDVKSHLFLSYLMYLLIYMLFKLQGKPINNHPIVKRLIYLKSLLIKLKPIEKKLDYQISKLLRLSSSFVVLPRKLKNSFI